MELVTLTENEYTEFASYHEQATFLQTLSWAKLKEKNGWHYELIGFKENDKVICGTMILGKTVFLGKKMFYAPRGFLIDYHNQALLNEFTIKVKYYLKKKGGIFLKIDPYVIYRQRDIDGNIVEGGIDNRDVVSFISKLGFHKQCKKPGQQSLQASFMYWINLKGKTFEEVSNSMNSTVKRAVKKNEKSGVILREGTRDELPKFKEVLDHTSERRNFISRPLSYYENMYDSFGENIKLYFVELNVEEQLKILKQEMDTLNDNYQQLLNTIKNTETRISPEKLKEKEEEIFRIGKKINQYEEMMKKHGSVVVLSAVLYFIYAKEVLSFVGGDYSEYLEFQPFTTMHYKMIEYAIQNGYDYYNMYGISSDLTEKNEMHGVYEYKKKFGGEVVELIGEYDLKLNSFFYILYKISYYIIHKLKKIKTKLHL